jgi:hypothetical protein
MSVNRATGREDPGRDDVVVRRGEHGWVVGSENVSDLTSAMVLADLFAAEHAPGSPAPADTASSDTVSNDTVSSDTVSSDTVSSGTAASDTAELGAVDGKPSARPPVSPAQGVKVPRSGKPGDVRDNEDEEAARLKVTVAQLEHALASRVTVEQAIGVLAEGGVRPAAERGALPWAPDYRDRQGRGGEHCQPAPAPARRTRARTPGAPSARPLPAPLPPPRPPVVGRTGTPALLHSAPQPARSHRRTWLRPTPPTDPNAHSSTP